MKKVLVSIFSLAMVLSLSHPAVGHAETSLNDQLLAASLSGDTATVQQLLDKGANIEARDMFNFTPLSKAVAAGKTGTVKLLLAKGANIDAKNNKGETALMLAEGKGHTEIVKLLQEKRAH